MVADHQGGGHQSGVSPDCRDDRRRCHHALQRLAKIGFDPMPGTIQSFADHIKAESSEWGRVVRQANIKIERR